MPWALRDLTKSVRIKAKKILRTHPQMTLDVKIKVIEADLWMGYK